LSSIEICPAIDLHFEFSNVTYSGCFPNPMLNSDLGVVVHSIFQVRLIWNNAAGNTHGPKQGNDRPHAEDQWQQDSFATLFEKTEKSRFTP
jgi:hypothetical protein